MQTFFLCMVFQSILKMSRHLGDQINTNVFYLKSTFFLLLPHLFVSLACVISNQNISSSLSPLLDKQMVSHPDHQLSDWRRVCCSTRQKKKKKKRVTIIPLIAETVWRRAETLPRERCYFPLMRISYEDKEEKQKSRRHACVTFHMQNSTPVSNICK